MASFFVLFFWKSVVLHLYEECQIKRCDMYHQGYVYLYRAFSKQFSHSELVNGANE